MVVVVGMPADFPGALIRMSKNSWVALANRVLMKIPGVDDSHVYPSTRGKIIAARAHGMLSVKLFII